MYNKYNYKYSRPRTMDTSNTKFSVRAQLQLRIYETYDELKRQNAVYTVAKNMQFDWHEIFVKIYTPCTTTNYCKQTTHNTVIRN